MVGEQILGAPILNLRLKWPSHQRKPGLRNSICDAEHSARKNAYRRPALYDDSQPDYFYYRTGKPEKAFQPHKNAAECPEEKWPGRREDGMEREKKGRNCWIQSD